MEKYLQYVEKFHENKQIEIDFINNQLKKHLIDNIENQTEIEEILDFLYSNDVNISKIGYKTILEKTKKWHKKLASLEVKNDEIEGFDIETIKDFGDGFKFVKLISENSYNREGKLMSHCVASYFLRDIKIYSLRDENNNPHCTIEENNQVKGKGNQTVENKYFGYCIKFLNEMGFSIGENEMKNIGYHKLEAIDNYLSVDEKYLYDGKYISEKNIDKIKDKDGKNYYGFGFLNLKPLINFKTDFSFKFNFDFKLMTLYFLQGIKEKTSGYRSTSATSGYRSTSATSGDKSTSATSGYKSTSATSGDESTSATSGDESTSATSGDKSTSATSGYRSTSATSGDESIIVINGKNNIGAANGKKVKAKGKKGNYFCLTEYDDDMNLLHCKLAFIDGESIKEDTFYTLINGEFTEATDCL